MQHVALFMFHFARLDRGGQLKEKIFAYHLLKGVVSSAAKASIKKRQL